MYDSDFIKLKKMYHCLTCIWLYTKRIHPHLPYIPKNFLKTKCIISSKELYIWH